MASAPDEQNEYLLIQSGSPSGEEPWEPGVQPEANHLTSRGPSIFIHKESSSLLELMLKSRGKF